MSKRLPSPDLLKELESTISFLPFDTPISETVTTTSVLTTPALSAISSATRPAITAETISPIRNATYSLTERIPITEGQEFEKSVVATSRNPRQVIGKLFIEGATQLKEDIVNWNLLADKLKMDFSDLSEGNLFKNFVRLFKNYEQLKTNDVDFEIEVQEKRIENLERDKDSLNALVDKQMETIRRYERSNDMLKSRVSELSQSEKTDSEDEEVIKATMRRKINSLLDRQAQLEEGVLPASTITGNLEVPRVVALLKVEKAQLETQLEDLREDYNEKKDSLTAEKENSMELRNTITHLRTQMKNIETELINRPTRAQLKEKDEEIVRLELLLEDEVDEELIAYVPVEPHTSTTREKMKQDREVYKLGLHNIAKFSREHCEQLLRDLCLQMKCRPEQLLIGVQNLGLVVNSVPKIRAFLQELCELCKVDDIEELPKVIKKARVVFDNHVLLTKIDERVTQSGIFNRITAKSKKIINVSPQILTEIDNLLEVYHKFIESKKFVPKFDSDGEINFSDVTDEYLREFFSYYCSLFDIKNKDGAYPKLAEIYQALREQTNVLQSLKSCVNMDGSASSAELMRQFTSIVEGSFKNITRMEQSEARVETLVNERETLMEHVRLIKELLEVSGVSSAQQLPVLVKKLLEMSKNFEEMLAVIRELMIITDTSNLDDFKACVFDLSR
ncbi:hypothetical protein PCE1_003538 [Barthelona sp. PCE]